MSVDKESPQAVFDRINRRRTLEGASVEIVSVSPSVEASGGRLPGSRPDPGVIWPTTASAAAADATDNPVRLDEILFADPAASSRDNDTFPRSATMRFILNNPAMALGVGVPAAAMLLKSQAARRVLQLALVVGTRQGVHDAVSVSAAALRLLKSAESPGSQSDSVRHAQKKAP